MNLKLIIATIMLASSSLLCGDTTETHKLLLNEGKEEGKRLDWQNSFFKKELVQALMIANSLKRLEGLTFLDFGCGVSSIYPDVLRFIGKSGKYIGVDASEQQIALAKKRFPKLSYIQGHENDATVIDKIAAADIIFIRFVIMHQLQQESFVKKFYSNMKAGAVLIIQEPEEKEEIKQEMIQVYPYAKSVTNLKTQVGNRTGMDYNFAGKLKNVLTNLKPQKMVHHIDRFISSTKEYKFLVEGQVNKFATKTSGQELFKKEEISNLRKELAKLPSDDKHYWFAEVFHTFVVIK